MDADPVSNGEGNTKEANDQGFRGSTGVEDRGTSSRESRELGRSSEFLAMEVGQNNRYTGRKPNDSGEVGCSHSSDEVG